MAMRKHRATHVDIKCEELLVLYDNKCGTNKPSMKNMLSEKLRIVRWGNSEPTLEKRQMKLDEELSKFIPMKQRGLNLSDLELILSRVEEVRALLVKKEVTPPEANPDGKENPNLPAV